MAIDKKIDYVEQDGSLNYIKDSESVTVPKKFKARKNAPATKLAYITDAEAKMLKKQKPGTPHKGPKGIPSYDSFGSIDRDTGRDTGVSGSQVSAAETGGGGSGMSSQDRDDFRSAAIAAGAGQRVNPGFFDDRNTVSKAELRRAKKFDPRAFRSTRGGISNFIQGGGFLGGLLSGIGRLFGLGKRFNEPYDRPQFAPGFATNPLQMQYDVGNEDLINLLKDENERETQTFTFDPSGMQRNDGIMSVARSNIDPQFQDLIRQIGLTKRQRKLLDQRKGMLPAIGAEGILDTIKIFDDKEDPATLEDVKKFYGIDV